MGLWTNDANFSFLLYAYDIVLVAQKEINLQNIWCKSRFTFYTHF